MRRTAALAAAFLFAACGQETPPAPQADVFAPPLWAVRDADSTLYLYGTIHVRKPGAPWGDAVVEAALAEAEEVWTEVLVDDLAGNDAAGVVARLGMTLDEPLSQTLPPELYARTVAAAEGLGLGAAQVEPMRPWLVALTLAIQPILAAGYDPDAGVEKGVDAAAEANGARPRAFETLDQQMRLFADLPLDEQIDLLEETLQDIDAGPAVVAELEAAWARGDTEALERMIANDMRNDAPELYNALIKARNDAWIEAVVTELEGAGVDFVAVGAGHLVGFDGLPQQLANRGYAVERIETGRARP